MRFLTEKERALYRVFRDLSQIHEKQRAKYFKNSSAKKLIENEQKALMYVPIDSYVSSRDKARKCFLAAIKREMPEVLNSLAEEVLPAYKVLYIPDFDGIQDYLMSSSILFRLDYHMGSACNNRDELQFVETLYEWCFAQDGIVFLPPELLPPSGMLYVRDFINLAPTYRNEEICRYMPRFKDYCEHHINKMMKTWDANAVSHFEETLLSWLDSWDVSADWFSDYTLQTLNSWCRTEPPADLDWAYNLSGVRVVELDLTMSFVFSYPPCDLETSTWSLYEERLDEAIGTAKESYRKQLNELALSEEQYLAKNKYKQEHFEWLAYFQLGVAEYAQIYDSYRSECNIEAVKTIEKAVKETANLISLKLRPGSRRPGRPRKTETAASA